MKIVTSVCSAIQNKWQLRTYATPTVMTTTFTNQFKQDSDVTRIRVCLCNLSMLSLFIKVAPTWILCNDDLDLWIINTQTLVSP